MAGHGVLQQHAATSVDLVEIPFSTALKPMADFVVEEIGLCNFGANGTQLGIHAALVDPRHLGISVGS